jgi:hypothetical protein
MSAVSLDNPHLKTKLKILHFAGVFQKIISWLGVMDVFRTFQLYPLNDTFDIS